MRAIEFFSGAGGFSLGMKRAGFDVIKAFELDWRHVETYNKNFGENKAICQDVSLLDFDQNDFGLDLSDLDVVFGGPPCQGFSTGGKQNITDDRNDLIVQFAKLIVQLRPKGFVMENVLGILNGKFKNKTDEFVDILVKGGYHVADPLVLNAKDYYVPQNRKRVFFFAVQKNLPNQLDVVPEVSSLDQKMSSIATVNDALQDILHINLEPNTQDLYEGEYGDSTVYSRALRLKENGSTGSDSNAIQLSGCMTTAHSLKVIDRFKNTCQGDVEPISRYKRLSLSGLSSTLRAGTVRGRGQFMAPRPIHPIYDRCITTREAARLHSYPDWFSFYPTKWYGMMQIGNSVPPHLSESVGNLMAKILE